MSDPEPVSIFKVKCGFIVPLIKCTTSGQAWIQTGDSKIHLMDRKGSIQPFEHSMSPIEEKRWNMIDDMALTTNGDIIFTDVKSHQITFVSRKWLNATSLFAMLTTVFKCKLT